MLVINFNGRKPAQQDYKFSVVGNAKVDIIRFTLQSDLDDYDDVASLSDVSAYVKVQSAGKEYIDKIRVNSTYQNDVLNVDLELAKKTTQYRNLAFQLQFEQQNGEIVSQTDIVYVSLSGNINADEEIPDKYPTALQQMEAELDDHEERIEKLEEDSGGVKGVGVFLENNDNFTVALEDKEGFPVSTATINLPYVRKEQGKGLSTNDFTNALKNRLINGITNVGDINGSLAGSEVLDLILQGDNIEQLKNMRKYFMCSIYGTPFDSTNVVGILYDDNYIDLYLLEERKRVCIYITDVADPFYDATIESVEVLPTKEYVDLIAQNLREIIAGKTMSYTISYQTVAPTQATFVANKYKRKDGTKIATWNDFETYVDTNIFGNSYFNSQSSSINLADQYIITTDNLVIRRDDLINGDNIYVIELDVPDRWFDSYGDDAYILETAKVDISSKVDKTDSANKLYGTDANGDQTTYNVAVGTTNNAVVQRNGSGQIKVPQTPSADDDSASKVYVDNKQNVIAPNYNATSTYVLGAKVIHDGKLYKCTTAITTAEDWDSTHWEEITVSSGFASIEQGYNVINATDIVSNTLTQAQYDLITNGKQTRIVGRLLGVTDALFLNTYIVGENNQYVVALIRENYYTCSFATYQINMTTKVISLLPSKFKFSTETGRIYWDGKALPQLPSSPTIDQQLVYGTDNTLKYQNVSGFKEIDAPSSTTLTDDEKAKIISGCKIKGTFMGFTDAIYLPAIENNANRFYGTMYYTSQTGVSYIQQYRVNENNIIQIPRNVGATARIELFDIERINSKNVVGYYLNNVYQYASNSTTTLQYETINNISISADTTFTLATAPTNTYPEYKANISNTSSSAITITLPSGMVIKTNDDNITISSNTFTLPASASVELNIQKGTCIVFNWAVSN